MDVLVIDRLTPAIADELQLVGCHGDLNRILSVAHDALGEAAAVFDTFSVGHTVADVVGKKFKDAVQKGFEKTLDVRLLLRMEGLAQILPDLQVLEHPHYVL